MPLSTYRHEDFHRLLATQDHLPAAVVERLQWFADYTEHHSVSRTCEHFGIARTTFYRWAERFDPADLSTLEDRPTRPDSEETTAPDAAADTRLSGSRGGRSVDGEPSVVAVPPAATQTPAEGRSVVRAGPDALHPAHCAHVVPCLLCWARAHDWSVLRRTLLVGSVRANLAFIASLQM